MTNISISIDLRTESRGREMNKLVDSESWSKVGIPDGVNLNNFEIGMESLFLPLESSH